MSKTYDEKYIEQKLVEKVKALGGRAYKFISPGNAGVPDRLIVLPGGKVGFAEMKRQGGKTTKIQDKQIMFLQSLDHVAGVIDRIEFIDPFIQAIQNQTTKNKDILAFSVKEVDMMNYVLGKSKNNKTFSKFEIEALSLIDLNNKVVVEWAREIWKNKDDLEALEEIKNMLEKKQVAR